MILRELKYPKRPVSSDSELGVSVGKYVGVNFTPETVEQIKKIIDGDKIPNPTNPEDFHSTIAHSVTDIKGYQPDEELEEPKEAKNQGI